MPTDLTDSVSGTTELIFPDDSTGSTYRLRELVVFEAEEVRDELGGEVPQYGSWVPVTVEETGEEAYLTAPAQLRNELVNSDVTEDERFEIVKMRKEGRDQSSPYQVSIDFPDRQAVPDDQASLEKATDGSGER
jgi:hypothetical protein